MILGVVDGTAYCRLFFVSLRRKRIMPNNMQNIICPRCGISLSRKTTFCPKCGSTIDSSMHYTIPQQQTQQGQMSPVDVGRIMTVLGGVGFILSIFGILFTVAFREEGSHVSGNSAFIKIMVVSLAVYFIGRLLSPNTPGLDDE